MAHRGQPKPHTRCANEPRTIILAVASEEDPSRGVILVCLFGYLLSKRFFMRLVCFSCPVTLLPQPLSPPLSPCNPTQRTCPHGHILCARPPPLPAPPPRPGYEKHMCVVCFSCSAALIPQPLSPTQILCPCGHNFHARALLLQPNTKNTCMSRVFCVWQLPALPLQPITKNVPMWACFSCSTPSLPIYCTLT